MSKFDRNRIKDGWEKVCTNKQTNKQTDRHYENNGHLAVNQKLEHPITHYILLKYCSLSTQSFNIVFWWLSSHVGVTSNEKEDKAAKSALNKPILWIPLPYCTTTLHPFNGLFSRTTWISGHQKGKQFWILLEQEMMGWLWHTLI